MTEENFINLTDDLLFEADSSGFLKDTNIHWEKTLNRSAESLKDRLVSDFIFESDRPKFYQQWQTLLEDKQPLSFSCHFTHTDGSIFLFSVRLMYCQKKGTIFGIAKNQTVGEPNNQQTYSKEKATNEDHLNNSQSAFCAIISHEMRTPLNGIIGMTDLLSKTALDNEQKELVDIIKTDSQDLLYVVNDILDFAKLASGTIKLRNNAINTEETLQKIVQTFSGPHLETKNLTLSSFVDGKIPSRLYGDVNRINQVLVNLLTNAIKFTSSGNIRLSAELKNQTTSEANIEFTVTDTGIGMPKEKINSLLKPFTQMDTSLTRQHGGIGMGLAICKQLADAMNGSLQISSRLNRGTSVSFSVPLNLHSENTLLPSESANKLLTPEDLEKHQMSILLVEDNPGNQIVANHLLKSLNLSADIVSNGQEAVEAVSNYKYDIVLMDVMMPVMNGLEATQKIRNMLNCSNEPYIIALTANAFQEDIEKSLEAGMNDHICKPLTQELLLKAFSGYLSSLKNS